MDFERELMMGHLDSKLMEFRAFQSGVHASAVECPKVDSNVEKMDLLRSYLQYREDVTPISIVLNADENNRNNRRLYINPEGLEELTIKKD